MIISVDPVVIESDNTTELIDELLFQFRSDDVIRVDARKRRSYELQNVHLILTDPRQRMYLRHDGHPPPIDRLVGRVLWEMRGAADVESIQYYDRNAHGYCNEHGIVESAYGQRILNQMIGIIDLLKKDPDTRRAVAVILSPPLLDDYLTKTEFPCVVGLHFYVRRGALHCTCYMRSQSCLQILPGDIFVFTAIHEFVAYCIGYELGSYHHFIVSAHVFENDMSYVDQVRTIANGEARDIKPLPLNMDSIDLQCVTEIERDLRINRESWMNDPWMLDQSAETELGQWLRVLALKHQFVHQNEKYSSFVQTLNPLYRKWIDRRKPDNH